MVKKIFIVSLAVLLAMPCVAEAGWMSKAKSTAKKAGSKAVSATTNVAGDVVGGSGQIVRPLSHTPATMGRGLGSGVSSVSSTAGGVITSGSNALDSAGQSVNRGTQRAGGAIRNVGN